MHPLIAVAGALIFAALAVLTSLTRRYADTHQSRLPRS